MVKLYRGISEKQCENYRKKGIQKGTKFTNELKEAKRFGKCIVEVIFQKKDLENASENIAHKEIKLKTRYYKNKKPIKKFIIKCKQHSI